MPLIPDPNRRADGRFGPGNNANPKGRPRPGLAFADAVRRRIDPDRILDLLDRYLADEKVDLEKRLSAVLPYINAGFLRPPTTAAVRVETAPAAPALDVAALPLEAQRQLLAAIQTARAALPPAPDDESDGD